MSKHLSLIIIGIYSLLVAHFVFSNYVQAIGPNIVLEDAVTCSEDDSTYYEVRGCLHTCPDELNFTDSELQRHRYYDGKGNEVSAHFSRGFPFATGKMVDWCFTSSTTLPITKAKMYNLSYILSITLAAVGICIILSLKNKPKTKAVRPRVSA